MAVYDVLPTTNLKVDDVVDTLRANGGVIGVDGNGMIRLSDLFTEGANINQWSLRKPFVAAVDFTDTWKSGFSLGYESVEQQNVFVYTRPTGGKDSPYRLGDFRGYNSKATPPASTKNGLPQVFVVPSENDVNQQTVSFKLYNADILKKVCEEFPVFTMIGVSSDSMVPIVFETDEDGSYMCDVGEVAIPNTAVYPRNPGLINYRSYGVRFAGGANNDYIFAERQENGYLQNLITCNAGCTLQGITINNPSANTRYFYGAAMSGQAEFTLSNRPPKCIFSSAMIMTWVGFDETSAKLILYISLSSEYPYMNDLINGLSMEGYGDATAFSLQAWYGHSAPGANIIIKDGDFMRVTPDGACVVTYSDQYDAGNQFGFSQQTYAKIQGKPLIRIVTPIIPVEMTQDKNVVVYSIVRN